MVAVARNGAPVVVLVGDEAKAVLDAVGMPPDAHPRRVSRRGRILTTILFCDIVSSTQTLAAIGDVRWRDLLDRYETVVRRELHRFDGRVVNSRGDDLLATFDRPTSALACACAIRDALAAHGSDVRVGVHAGECEVRGDDLAGIGVHIAARVMELAGPGQILVSSTVRDLVAGSGLEFADCGARELRGVPGCWGVHEYAPAEVA